VCTVAFVPTGGGGYLLGHNRDESRRRARGTPPSRFRRGGRAFLAPRDPQGGGTWIGTNDAGTTLCLLNAAETHSARLPQEPVSRGRVLWDLLHLDSAGAVGDLLAGQAFRLRDVRAFHLVVAVRGRRRSGARIARFRWNGARLSMDRHEGPSLFVSSGLDQAGAERERRRSWRSFLRDLPRGARERGISAAASRALSPAGAGPETAARIAAWLSSHEPERGALSVCMHRGGAASVSRTLVTVTFSGTRLSYHDGPPCEAGAQEFRRRLVLR